MFQLTLSHMICTDTTAPAIVLSRLHQRVTFGTNSFYPENKHRADCVSRIVVCTGASPRVLC